jgi:hypothetical protein
VPVRRAGRVWRDRALAALPGHASFRASKLVGSQQQPRSGQPVSTASAR